MSNVCGHWDDGVGLRRVELVAPLTIIRNSYEVFFRIDVGKGLMGR